MLSKYLTHSDASSEVGAELIRAGAGHMPIVASGTLVAAGVIWFLLHDIVARRGSDSLIGSNLTES